MKIHPLSDVQSKDIGDNTTIWQYCVVLAGAKIGSNCNICSHCFVENDVVIGDRVTVKNGVYIFDSIYIKDGVFIGPNVTFTNDIYPKSQRGTEREPSSYPKTIIDEGASIGGGATILPGIKIGKGALIGAGAVVTKDVKPKTVVFGKAANEQSQEPQPRITYPAY
jgi:UDP-2-acetamido-3-amino-2,3-dideoxy-glucuronate N-acetyltransferase